LSNINKKNKNQFKKTINSSRDINKINKLLGFEYSIKTPENINKINQNLEKFSRLKSNPILFHKYKNKSKFKSINDSNNNSSSKNLIVECFNQSESKNLKNDSNNIIMKKPKNKIEFFNNNVYISIFSGNYSINGNLKNLNNNSNIKLVSNDAINIELIELFTSTSENGCINFNYFMNSFIKVLDKYENFEEDYEIGPFLIRPDETEFSKIYNNNQGINVPNIQNKISNNSQDNIFRRKIVIISVKKLIISFQEQEKNKYLIIIKEKKMFLSDGVNNHFTNFYSNSSSAINNLKEKNFPSSELNNFYQRTNIFNPSTINLNINQNISINNNDLNKLNTLQKEDQFSNLLLKNNSNSKIIQNFNQIYPNSHTKIINQNTISDQFSNGYNGYQNFNFNNIAANNNVLMPNFTNSYMNNFNHIQSSLSSRNYSQRFTDYGNNQFKISPTTSINNNDGKNSAKYSNNSNNINIHGNSNLQISQTGMNNITNKLSSILHDFKHVIYDNLIYFEFLVNKYILKNNQMNKNESAKNLTRSLNHSYQDLNSFKDELNYFSVMKEYIMSLILNITNFMSNNEFLVGEFSSNIDIIKIINIMIKIFNRRLEFENSTINSENDENNINYNLKNNDAEFLNTKQPLVNLKNIKIKCMIIDPDNPLYKKINSNQNLLISLFYNILSNSYKYTNNGEIKVELSIVKLNNKNQILVTISDSGKGIPQEILDNWGKPFNFHDKSQGTGLGQFIISTLEKNLGLIIPKPEKNSKYSSGSVFKIYIPTNSDYLDKGSNIGMSIIGNSVINPFCSPKNQSSIYLKSTLIQNHTLFIEENFKNFIEYDENALAKNNFYIRTIYIVCLDDELIFLNALNKSLKGFINILEHYKFEVIFTSNFNDFMSEFMSLINKNILVDFFIFDQNISENIKGLDCSRIVNNFYKIYYKERYKELKYYFFFITEDLDVMKQCAEDKKIKKFLKKDQIFGKMQFNDMCLRIKNIIQDKDRLISKPSQRSFNFN